MYQYTWDEETGGPLLTTEQAKFSKEPRPVYCKELDILGFDRYWNYPKDDSAPIMWAEANNYIYRGRTVARTKGGSLYTAPELVILEEPEPDGGELRLVDTDGMAAKNAEILETLVQETIQKVYNTYLEYKNKVDLFYVAFSGGKDSVVALDIVQRALPHDAFMVLFGDTQMEFSDTYAVIDKTEQWCNEQGIRFVRAKSQFEPDYTWNTIGPPAQKMRWCCSVHKTAPQILLLRQITKNPHFRGMAMMGVRADESVTRSRYDELNFGTKHQGQYDFYPILKWNSAELYMYIYQKKLLLNETYKRGNSRAGCLVCPMEAVKNTWFKEQSYAGSPTDRNTTTFYNEIIMNKTIAKDLPPNNQKEFMEIGVWKSRHNGSKLSSPSNLYHEERIESELIITLDKVSADWREWLKTLGQLNFLPNNIVEIFCDGNRYIMEYNYTDEKHFFRLRGLGSTQKEIYFLSWLKTVLRKSAYCIKCRVCEANCPNGFIHMTESGFNIDDKCTKCKKCYNINSGCVVAASQSLPKEGNRMNGSIDQYKNMGIRYSWVEEYFKKKDDFWENNGLGKDMVKALKLFLRHAMVTEKDKITPFGELVAKLGTNSASAWALMICNLVYTPQFNWWVMNIDTHRSYTSKEIDEMLKELLTANSRKNVISGFKMIFYTNPVLSNEICFGSVSVESKGKNTYLIDACRGSWSTPDPRVILYSLYKFAEKCNTYQFRLSTLLDDAIERDGISPTRIFGLDRDTMISLLNGLTVNYIDFIDASFTLGLETITLRSDKSSDDVLSLF
ncbi:MAG: phosphoadenosine phosphosulfate reductase family protein [Oscillospiraceae bacterium]